LHLLASLRICWLKLAGRWWF